jgi:DNA-cytosine methyltransferase
MAVMTLNTCSRTILYQSIPRRSELYELNSSTNPSLKFIDLFCGIGGFHFGADIAASKVGVDAECVFASDIDKTAQKAYEANFGLKPAGDITKLDAKHIPEHDVLFGGFPCQPFSIIGDKKGFDDTRGTLFFDIVRILNAKRPAAFVLENVKIADHSRQRSDIRENSIDT